MTKKPPQNSPCVGLYGRVSGDRQEREQTIETQLYKLHERVQADGLSVYAEYLDNPYTGTVINRPALDRLMDDARKGCFSRVLVYAPDRLSRGKPWMRGYLEEQLARAGVSVTYLTYEVEDTKEGRAKDGMVSVFNEWERETLVQRMKDGRDRRIKEGAIWRGPRPYGWRYVLPVDGERYGHMELVPEEAAIVREIFDWILAGRTTFWIASELNRRGALTVKGKAWSYATVARVVHNHLHCGQPPVNRYQTCEPAKPRKAYSGKSAKSSNRERPQEEWKRVTIPYSIVTPEEQRMAEERLSANRKLSTRNAKHPYLLSGLCRCGWERLDDVGTQCGTCFTGGATNKSYTHFQYRCHRVYRTIDHTLTRCKGRVATEAVEGIVWQQIVALLQQPDTLLAQMAEAEAESHVPRRRWEEDIAGTTAALDSVQDNLKALLRKNLTGLIDDDTYQAVQADLIAQRQQLQLRLSYAHQALDATRQQQARWGDVRTYCTAVAERLTELELPEHFARRQELVRTLITQVVIYPDHISIEGVLPAMSADVIDNSTPWCSGERSAGTLGRSSGCRRTRRYPIYNRRGQRRRRTHAVGVMASTTCTTRHVRYRNIRMSCAHSSSTPCRYYWVMSVPSIVPVSVNS